MKPGAEEWTREVALECYSCAILSNHGLVGWQCSPECRKQRCKATGLQLHDTDHGVWLSIGHSEFGDRKPGTPKCPWCGSAMEPFALGRPTASREAQQGKRGGR